MAFLGTARSLNINLKVGVITSGLTALAIFFFFPETRYQRDQTAVSDNRPGTDEKHTNDITEFQETITPRKTFLQELNPWSGLDRQANLLTLLLRPWPMIVYPAVILSFLGYSATLAWLLVVTNTYASIFQAPPFNFSPSINGLINISGLIGILLGAYAGGALTDKVAEWKARKNHGVYEPEFRLITLVIPFLVIPFGLLTYLKTQLSLRLGMESEWSVKPTGLFPT